MPIFHNLVVKEIKKETDKAVSINFSIPEDLKINYEFIPGQYVTIQKELNNKTIRRAYSLCSSVKSNDFRIAVKEVENGLFSKYANTKLKEGEILEVSEPEGKFVLNPSEENNKKYIAFAAGSGITPVLSMIKSVIDVEPNSIFVLVYGNKSPKETIFKSEIDRLLLSFNSRFFVYYVYSKEQVENAFGGRICDDIINEVMGKIHNQIKFDSAYLCGPESMIEIATNSLLDKGFEKENIKFELFTTSSEENTNNQNLEGISEISVLLDEEEFTYTMNRKDLILNTALEQGLDAPYSCQGGICSSCLARVTEGEAIMEKNTILNEEEVKEGLILTCQAHPVTAKIKIDYDDV